MCMWFNRVWSFAINLWSRRVWGYAKNIVRNVILYVIDMNLVIFKEEILY